MGRTPSADIEEDLLEAAERILTEEGPSAITVRKVATCAGVAPMGVYNRFDGKHGLLEALFVRGFRELRTTIARANGPDALARLRDSGRRYREFAVAHPEHYRLMFELMHEVAPGESAMMEAFASFEQLVQLVTAARALQPLGEGSDVEVAQQFWGVLHGAVGLELLGIGFADDPGLTFDRTLDATLAGLVEVGSGR
jgi:AcrR family transcriptional regulator